MGRRQELIVRRRNPIEQMKLVVAVDDVGQAPKVEDLPWSEDTSYDEELTREVNTAVWGGAACFGSEAGGYWYV